MARIEVGASRNGRWIPLLNQTLSLKEAVVIYVNSQHLMLNRVDKSGKHLSEWVKKRLLDDDGSVICTHYRHQA